MIWWSFFIPWISSTGKKCVRVLVHTTWVIATPTHCKALNCVDTWPQQTCDQPAESLDWHSVCWWKYRCTVVDRTDSVGKLLFRRSYFWNIFAACILSRRVSYYKCTPAAQAPSFLESKTVGFLRSLESGEQERWGRILRLERGFMTFNSICIIVCISCSVSTQCQHGWSLLISKLHHKDKRNTCRYKVILLPTAHVKLFRTRQAGSCCGCINESIIASWFLEAKSLI